MTAYDVDPIKAQLWRWSQEREDVQYERQARLHGGELVSTCHPSTPMRRADTKAGSTPAASTHRRANSGCATKCATTFAQRYQKYRNRGPKRGENRVFHREYREFPQ